MDLGMGEIMFMLFIYIIWNKRREDKTFCIKHEKPIASRS